MRRAADRALLLAALVFLAAAPALNAEIYKCVGRDGKTLFTSDRSQCPGAERHEPTGEIQTVPTTSKPSGRAAPARRRGGSLEQSGGGEALWRGKKLRAEAELRDLGNRIEYVRQAVKWCNRGHSLYAQDETGIRHEYDCEKVDNEFEQLKARQSGLRIYLAEGLEEECRRAGCLPGWIR
jgi:hypothetical protein